MMGIKKILIICIVIFCIGFNKGKKATYEPEKLIATNAYMLKIAELQKKVYDNTANYDKEIALIQSRQATELNALQKKQILERNALKAEQIIKINDLQKNNYTDMNQLAVEHEKEIIKTRDSYYIKGQTDIRTSIQNNIDSKARENMTKNDWDAPVYSVKKLRD
ncbi:hypothetical protein LQZ19_05460 [Treponema primitia]|uniref:hypothetical protein n=1 Tax=Treponema primitia TaxID=88058 RepID=UPI00397F73DB